MCVCVCVDVLRNTFPASAHAGKGRKGMMREKGDPLGVVNVCRRCILRSTGEDGVGVRGSKKMRTPHEGMERRNAEEYNDLGQLPMAKNQRKRVHIQKGGGRVANRSRIFGMLPGV